MMKARYRFRLLVSRQMRDPVEDPPTAARQHFGRGLRVSGRWLV
jgi:hypothetical protein